MTFDIYTNRVPFGLLTEDEQRQLLEYEGEFEIYSYDATSFFPFSTPAWCHGAVYRAVRPAPTKSSINWGHVADELIAMAMDKNRSTWLYKKIPNAGEVYWTGGGGGIPAKYFYSFVPGTCHWRDSLVIRPGYEGGA